MGGANFARGFTSGTAAVAMLVLVVGCAPGKWDRSVATEIVTPDIVWDDGPPAGEWEANEFVKAARAAELGIVLAQNSHDYTIEQLTDHVAPDFIAWLYENDLHMLDVGVRVPQINPGPLPLGVMSVTETADGADVEFCSPSGKWAVYADHPNPDVDPKNGVTTTISMVRTEDGAILLTETGGVLTECDATGIAVGRFSPEPELPDEVPIDAVRPPLGYEKE